LIEKAIKDGKEKEIMDWMECCISDLLSQRQDSYALELMKEFQKFKIRRSNNISIRLNLENLLLRIRRNNI
jgi:hypothetical protein